MEVFDLILKNIAKHISLNDLEQSYFCSLLEPKQLVSKEFVLMEERTCRYFYFVNKGALRAYFINKDGKESTIMFALRDWWVTDMHAYVKGQPAMLNIVALEESEILQISKTNFDLLLKEVPKFEQFYRIIFQNAYIREQLRTIQNLSLTAAERYEHFILKYPAVIQQVPQKQIASYLGITPEFLSTIRNKRTKK